MMVELRAITEENFIDAFNLRLAPGQEEYVPTRRAPLWVRFAGERMKNCLKN